MSSKMYKCFTQFQRKFLLPLINELHRLELSNSYVNHNVYIYMYIQCMIYVFNFCFNFYLTWMPKYSLLILAVPSYSLTTKLINSNNFFIQLIINSKPAPDWYQISTKPIKYSFICNVLESPLKSEIIIISIINYLNYWDVSSNLT